MIVIFLSPTVCHHYFSALRGSKIEKEHIITAVSQISRREEGTLKDFSRLTNFLMREVVFLGDKEYCSIKMDEILSATVRWLDSDLQLKFRVITSCDPFFGEMADLKKQAQLAFGSKLEIQTYLPFSESWLPIASLNWHGRIFYERFGLLSSNPNMNCSGCVGWGYERFLFSILAQKGLDFSSEYYRRFV